MRELNRAGTGQGPEGRPVVPLERHEPAFPVAEAATEDHRWNCAA